MTQVHKKCKRDWLYESSVNAQYYTLTSNVDGKAIASHPIQNATKQITSITSFVFPISTTSGPRLPLQPATFHLTPLHTPKFPQSPATIPCPKTLSSQCTLTVTYWTHTHAQTRTHTHTHAHTHTHTHTPQNDLFGSPVNATVLLLTSDVSPLKVTLQV